MSRYSTSRPTTASTAGGRLVDCWGTRATVYLVPPLQKKSKDPPFKSRWLTTCTLGFRSGTRAIYRQFYKLRGPPYGPRWFRSRLYVCALVPKPCAVRTNHRRTAVWLLLRLISFTLARCWHIRATRRQRRFAIDVHLLHISKILTRGPLHPTEILTGGPRENDTYSRCNPMHNSMAQVDDGEHYRNTRTISTRNWDKEPSSAGTTVVWTKSARTPILTRLITTNHTHPSWLYSKKQRDRIGHPLSRPWFIYTATLRIRIEYMQV